MLSLQMYGLHSPASGTVCRHPLESVPAASVALSNARPSGQSPGSCDSMRFASTLCQRARVGSVQRWRTVRVDGTCELQ
jgi:hypothetical protein